VNYYERIAYDPSTGDLRWTVAGRGINKGAIAGSVTRAGYRQVRVGFKVYRAHRLAWFLVHGKWPDGEIDHINGDRADNRLANLRVVDRAGNSQNRRKAHRDSSHGLLGAAWNRQHKRWQAKIMANGKRHHLGYFDTAEAAHAAHMAAKQRLHISGGGH
jgi:hypothetical protein